MKKLILLFVFILNCVMLSYSQRRPKDTTITIDFLEANGYPDTSRLWNKSNVKVKLINFNRNLYTVESSKTETNYNSIPPAIFSGIKVPGFLSVRPTINSAKSNFAQSAEGNFTNDMNENDLVDFSVEIPKALAEIKRRAVQLNNSALLNNDLVNLALTCEMNFDTAIKERTRMVNEYLRPFSCTDQIILRRSLRDSINMYTKGSLQGIAYFNKLADRYIEILEDSVEERQKSIEENKIVIEAPSTKQETKVKYQSRNIEINSEIKAYEKEIANIKKCVSQVDETEKEILAYLKDNRPNTLLTNFDLINETNFVYETDMTKLKVDELAYNIKTKAEKALPCNRPREKNIEIAILNKSGFKVDFSTGVFINGGNKDFLQRDYYYKTIDSSSVSIEAYDRGKRALLSIGALMHLYFRNAYGVNAGLALGVSTTTGFDAINFHAGPSIIFGRKDRVALSCGITLRESKVLADGKDLGVKYTKTDLPEAPPTVGKFPIAGWFFSITYNWSKLVSKKAE